MANFTAGFVVQGIVATYAEEIVAQAVIKRLSVTNDKEREIFRQNRPLVSGSLQVDDGLIHVKIYRIGRDRNASRANCQLKTATNEQIHRGAPIQLVRE